MKSSLFQNKKGTLAGHKWPNILAPYVNRAMLVEPKSEHGHDEWGEIYKT